MIKVRDWKSVTEDHVSTSVVFGVFFCVFFISVKTLINHTVPQFPSRYQEDNMFEAFYWQM